MFSLYSSFTLPTKFNSVILRFFKSWLNSKDSMNPANFEIRERFVPSLLLSPIHSKIDASSTFTLIYNADTVTAGNDWPCSLNDSRNRMTYTLLLGPLLRWSRPDSLCHMVQTFLASHLLTHRIQRIWAQVQYLTHLVTWPLGHLTE